METQNEVTAGPANRRSFIGGSDARIIMGSDEVALVSIGVGSGPRIGIQKGPPRFTF